MTAELEARMHSALPSLGSLENCNPEQFHICQVCSALKAKYLASDNMASDLLQGSRRTLSSGDTSYILNISATIYLKHPSYTIKVIFNETRSTNGCQVQVFSMGPPSAYPQLAIHGGVSLAR